ncbi:MAG TPA: phosphate signaling complex protein PhoU [Xanthobacteraceae bacterium]|nr:phosphate signaling complex protein PhoU [Xanthobacteraceae bacterium]
MQEHIVKSFDIDLQSLARMVTEMGGLAEKQIVEAIGALTRLDTALANRIVAEDAKIDALQHQIEELAVLVLARRQPVAVDLREIIAALRICNDLERIGDLAKNIAKRVNALADGFQLPGLMRGIERMADLVLTQLKDVLDSYARRDSTKAVAVWRGDEQVDAFNNSLFRELLTYMLEEPRNIGVCIHLVFCVKNIERIGDHATNIAETVYYMIEGQQLAETRPKGDITSVTRITPSNQRRTS